ncbi:hypothetical protein N7462_009149 [Penicillium macrosclerotiorum]|uniref:uncharacterized protein n=1 Tax=Penicillium macrosclerotiorum TaxID=303699 RepID=UPI002546FA59|nr:uncharacterized protein N7462_009149 [Penicillium macrosclerotiorum]KAJ5676252.1 hypothetical protein N7462_009149 [Penicillium macrosclerotiorum]
MLGRARALCSQVSRRLHPGIHSSVGTTGPRLFSPPQGPAPMPDARMVGLGQWRWDVTVQERVACLWMAIPEGGSSLLPPPSRSRMHARITGVASPEQKGGVNGHFEKGTEKERLCSWVILRFRGSLTASSADKFAWVGLCHE